MSTSDTAVSGDAPTRVCRKCSTQSQTAGEFCPHCGARYTKHRRSRRARILMLGIPLVLLVAGGGVAAGLIIHHNDQVAAHNRQVAARHHAARLAAQRAARQRRQAAASLQSVERTTMVNSLQSSVKKTAEQDVSNGVLTGPILQVQCQPASTADTTASIATYSCIAANKVSNGELNGYTFTGTINTTTGSYTWHLGG